MNRIVAKARGSERFRKCRFALEEQTQLPLYKPFTLPAQTFSSSFRRETPGGHRSGEHALPGASGFVFLGESTARRPFSRLDGFEDRKRGSHETPRKSRPHRDRQRQTAPRCKGSLCEGVRKGSGTEDQFAAARRRTSSSRHGSTSTPSRGSVPASIVY